MLVLARERGQTIEIIDREKGDTPIVTLKVVDLNSKKVRIGLEADLRYQFLRDDAINDQPPVERGLA